MSEYTRKFLQRCDEYAEVLNVLNLDSSDWLRETCKSFDMSSELIIEEVNSGISAINFHIDVIQEEEDGCEMANVSLDSLCSIMLDNPVSLRMVIDGLLQEEETKGVEIMLEIFRVLKVDGEKDNFCNFGNKFIKEDAIRLDLLIDDAITRIVCE